MLKNGAQPVCTTKSPFSSSSSSSFLFFNRPLVSITAIYSWVTVPDEQNTHKRRIFIFAYIHSARISSIWEDYQIIMIYLSVFLSIALWCVGFSGLQVNEVRGKWRVKIRGYGRSTANEVTSSVMMFKPPPPQDIKLRSMCVPMAWDIEMILYTKYGNQLKPKGGERYLDEQAVSYQNVKGRVSWKMGWYPTRFPFLFCIIPSFSCLRICHCWSLFG